MYFYKAEPISPPNPYNHFKGLTKSVERLKKACLYKEKIAICGDYDADGMTSTALLIKTLTTLNIKTIAAIPNRIMDGYGLNENMVDNLKDQNVDLLITVSM